jgi:hypothetical protein
MLNRKLCRIIARTFMSNINFMQGLRSSRSLRERVAVWLHFGSSFMDQKFTQNEWAQAALLLGQPPADLTPLRFYVWGCIKDAVYLCAIAHHLAGTCWQETELLRLLLLFMLTDAWAELEYGYGMCRAARGTLWKLFSVGHKTLRRKLPKDGFFFRSCACSCTSYAFTQYFKLHFNIIILTAPCVPFGFSDQRFIYMPSSVCATCTGSLIVI